jgi:hypothetical protein
MFITKKESCNNKTFESTLYFDNKNSEWIIKKCKTVI